MKHTLAQICRFLLIVAVLASILLQPLAPARAAGELTLTPITWNVIGLDSNNVLVGPNNFPIGVRVCNTSQITANNVKSAFIFDDLGNLYNGDPYINLRGGTYSAFTGNGIDLAPGACYDFYYEVTVTRDSNAYNHTRSYHITASADGGVSGSTPTTRELFVEYLISQSRNSTEMVWVSTDQTFSVDEQVFAGGTMTLMVGQEYWIKLDGFTATNGYEQIETFINLPNTIFQVLSVSTTYTADTTPNFDSPLSRLYGDGCTWENNPLSPNYRSCLSTGKAGGDITVTYHVKVISIPTAPLTNPEALMSLIYDFSGSSYHYNADFGGSTRYVNVVDASIAKVFRPKYINPGGTSDLTFTITNPGPAEITSVNFVDNLPSGMTISSTSVIYTNCGLSASPASLTVGAISLSFSNLTVSGLGTCTIKVTVTASNVGTYNNTSNHLFIGTQDTFSIATDSLIVSTVPPGPSTCVSGAVNLATWTMEPGAGLTVPPTYTYKIPGSANPTAQSSGGTSSISTTGNPANSWEIAGGWLGLVLPDPNTATYYQFNIDTSLYYGVTISFTPYIYTAGDWASAGENNRAYVYSNPDSTGWTSGGTGTAIDKQKWNVTVSYAAPTTGLSSTSFRINFAGARVGTANALIDNVIIQGCLRPTVPTLSKAFSPDPIGLNNDESTLTFTFTNPNASVLTGVTFTDTLPTGLVISSPNDLTTPSCTTGTVTGQTITASAETTLIKMTGAILSANASCSFSVSVKGTAAGQYFNISDRISSSETGPNSTSTGYGQDDLTVLAPPVVSKLFGTDTILTGGQTRLTFIIKNPNLRHELSGVAFRDVFPTSPGAMTVADPLDTTNTCGVTLSDSGGGALAAGDVGIQLTGVTLPPGGSCTFSVVITATTTGTYTNNSDNVSHLIHGITVNGNTATDTLMVEAPNPDISLLKQVSSDGVNWYTSTIIPTGSTVWYKFTVENIGDQPLTAIDVVDDPAVNTALCNWTNPLPVADSSEYGHITTCIVNGGLAVAGTLTDTATAQGTFGGTPYYSDPDTANYRNYNFGHLPSAYLGMNLISDGGAYFLNGTTFLGASVDTNDLDGINTPTYTSKLTDNGVFWTGVWENYTGHATVVATCSPSGTRWVYAWFDWNQDYDFNDLNETYSEQMPCSPTGVNNEINFTFPEIASRITGTVAVTTGSPAITGTGTAFTTELTVGSKLYINSVQYTVASITDDTHLTLTANYIGGTNSGLNASTGTLSEGTYYSRFRIYDTAPVAALPYGIAYTAGGVPIVGEIEDPPIISEGGTTPTPVTLAYFRAQRQGSSVTFEWSTATEMGNIGFNLYVEEDGRLTRINADLIPSLVIESLQPQDYTYTTDVEGNVFYIEDISTIGEILMHGPFHLGQPFGDRPVADEVDWSAVQLENAGFYASQQAALKRILRVPAAALAPATSGASTMQLPISLNLKVRQTGIYRLTFEMLRDAGLNLTGVPIRKVTITNRGQMVPIYVEGSSKFGPGAFIEFFGQALDTLYTDTNIYTIQVSSTPADRMQGNSASVGAGLVPPTSYIETMTVNNQRVYATSAPGSDPWYDTVMSVNGTAMSLPFQFQVDALADTSVSTNLELVVWGMSSHPQDPDHHVKVSVNGVAVADSTFDGMVEQTLNITLPAGVLHAGSNTLTLTLPADTGAPFDTVYLDKYSLSYPRPFQARDGQLTFTSTAKSFQVTNLPTKNVVVYRIDDKGMFRLSGVSVKAVGGTYTATFAGTNQVGTYWVTAVEKQLVPVMEAVRTTPDLNQPAEYLIIAHPNFINADLQRLVAARQAQGFTVSVVNVIDLYTQYSNGIFEPQAIQKYIAYAVENLGTEYVLLVGGDTYDYRNFLGRNSISFIPSLYVSTGPMVQFVPADPLYADINNDNVPDIAIGRFPVRSVAQLAGMVTKTLAYATKSYAQTALFASDAYDGIVSYRAMSNALAANIPSGWTLTNLSLDELSVSTARTRLVAAMNAGTALITYTGHSAPDRWSSSFFTISDAYWSVNNPGKSFVVVQYGCWNNYYVDPITNFLVQAFLVYGDKGAAATLGASTLVDSSSEHMLGMLLTPRLVTPGMTIGQAVRDAKLELAANHPELLDVLLGWSLMGDPALVIQP